MGKYEEARVFRSFLRILFCATLLCCRTSAADKCGSSFRDIYHFTSLAQWREIERSGAMKPVTEDVLRLLAAENRASMAPLIQTAIFGFERENFLKTWTKHYDRMPAFSSYGSF